MEIGGYDLLYTWPQGTKYAQIEEGILDLCKAQWPEMVVEYDDPPNGAPTLARRRKLDRNEFFIFQSPEAKDLWDRWGYSRRYTHNSMVYVIIESNAAGKPWAVADQEITVVVDHPRGYKVRNIVRALNSFLVPVP